MVSEEELRAQFANCGAIENIRLVRDPKTHLGKGIGYIMFSTQVEMQHALKQKRGMKFKGRELRINRATEPKGREKKKNRKEAALKERRERKNEKMKGSDDDEPLPPRNFEIDSEDSDDDDEKLANSSFGKRAL